MAWHWRRRGMERTKSLDHTEAGDGAAGQGQVVKIGGRPETRRRAELKQIQH